MPCSKPARTLRSLHYLHCTTPGQPCPGPAQARCFPGPHTWAAQLLCPSCPSAARSRTKRVVPLELQRGINQRNAAEKAATSSGCANQGGAIRGEKKKVAGDILILLNDGKEHQRAQNIFLPNFCHDGLSYVFSSGSGMQVRLPSHVWFWGQFCSESVLATTTNQHAKILPCLWDLLGY